MGPKLGGAIEKTVEVIKTATLERVNPLDDSGKWLDGPDLPDDSGKKLDGLDLQPAQKTIDKVENAPENNAFELRNLTDAEKQVLKGVGMTDANIEKCAVDADGKFQLSCKNQGLEGNTHPATNVPYERRTVDISSVKIEGVFPVFESTVTYQLPDSLIKSSEKSQFTYLNQCLLKDIKTNPKFDVKFTDQQIAILSIGKNPPGFTWHHNENCGKMQLVSTEIHAQSGHTGGDSIWCSR